MFDVILICGDRHWNEQNIAPMLPIIESLPDDSTVISGGAPGADTTAHILADVADHCSSIQVFADWSKYGRKAGPIRNRKQYDDHVPVAVFAFHDTVCESKGTKDMLMYAISQKCPYVYCFDGEGRCYLRKFHGPKIEWIEQTLEPQITYVGYDTCGNIYEWDEEQQTYSCMVDAK